MVTIRQTRLSDLGELLSLDQIARGDEKRRLFIADAVSSGQCWVAEGDGAILGYVILDYSFYGCGFVSLLYVREGFRRQGVGSALMRHAVGQCRSEKLFTSTNQSNQAMQALLQSAGFGPSGTIENLDEGDPELVYFRKISPVPAGAAGEET